MPNYFRLSKADKQRIADTKELKARRERESRGDEQRIEAKRHAKNAAWLKNKGDDVTPLKNRPYFMQPSASALSRAKEFEDNKKLKAAQKPTNVAAQEEERLQRRLKVRTNVGRHGRSGLFDSRCAPMLVTWTVRVV